MKQSSNSILGGMYFQSFGDFTSTFLKVHPWSMTMSFLASVVGLITGYIYHDAYVVVTIVCVFGLDLLTGIYASYIKKADEEGKNEGIKTFILAIQSRKLLRSFISMTFHLALLSIAWHISKSQTVYSWLPGLLVGAVLGTQFVSVMENLYKAKVIKAAVFELVISNLDLKKLLARKKEKQD